MLGCWQEAESKGCVSACEGTGRKQFLRVPYDRGARPCAAGAWLCVFDACGHEACLILPKRWE